jgi:putative ABC transport system permease protein
LIAGRYGIGWQENIPKTASMLKNYFRIAWRIISRNRLYTLISVFSLALGICGCTVIWLVAHYEFSFDRFHPDSERIYRVGNGGREQKSSGIIPPMPVVIRRTVPGVEAVTTFYNFRASPPVMIPAAGKRPAVQFSTDVKGENRLGNYILADADWFTIFKYQWMVGDPVALRQPFAVVLTEDRARQYFGSLTPESYIGRELIYEDSLRVRVAGIVKDWTANSDLPYSAFISFATIDASFLKNKRHMDDWVWHEGVDKWYWPSCFIRLGKGVRSEQVEARLLTIGKQVIGSDSAHPFEARLQPLADIHFNADYRDDGIRKAHLPTLYGLMGIAVFILILGTVNFVNLSTAQSIQRAKEIGVRKVLGSGRSSIMVQFLTETGIITVLSVVLAALLVRPVMAFFGEYIPIGVHFRLLDPATLLFLLGVTVITTLLAGFYPAKVLAGYLPVLSLKGSGAQKGGEKWLLRKSLIVFQFTISLVFIIVALLMGNQIRYMLETDYGFKTDAIVTVRVGSSFWDTSGRINVIEQEFGQLPGIAEVVKEAGAPIGWGGYTMSVEYKGKDDITQAATMEFGNDRLIPFYGMRVVAGRNIRRSDSLTEWVINETSARGFGFTHPADAVGRLLYFGPKAYPIVGVVADFHEGSFKEAIRPAVIGNMSRWELFLGVKLASAGKSPEKVKTTLAAMEKVYKRLYPDNQFEYLFMDESIASLYETERKTAALVRAVLVLAVFISSMGLFGLALFTARRKAAEISIRKVLGATTTDIATLLNKGFVGLVLLSLVIASPVAWWLTDRWLRDFAYRTAVAWWVFPLAGAGAVLIALITVSLQSIRAAMANPVNNLRSE